MKSGDYLKFFKGKKISKEKIFQKLENNKIGFYNPRNDIFDMLKYNDKSKNMTMGDIDRMFTKLGDDRLTHGEKKFFLKILDFDSDGEIGFRDFNHFLDLIQDGKEMDSIDNYLTHDFFKL